MGFFKKLFGRGKSPQRQKSGHVKCPHCGNVFQNTAADNPVDALIHGMLSASGETDTSQVSKCLGIDPTEFTCPKCRRKFTL